MKSPLKILLIVLLCLAVLGLAIWAAFYFGRQLGGEISNTASQLGLSSQGELELTVELTDLSMDFGSDPASLDLEIIAGSFTLA